MYGYDMFVYDVYVYMCVNYSCIAKIVNALTQIDGTVIIKRKDQILIDESTNITIRGDILVYIL